MIAGKLRDRDRGQRRQRLRAEERHSDRLAYSGRRGGRQVLPERGRRNVHRCRQRQRRDGADQGIFSAASLGVGATAAGTLTQRGGAATIMGRQLSVGGTAGSSLRAEGRQP